MCFLLYLYGNFSLTSLPIMPAFLSLERPLAFRIREAMLYIVSLRFLFDRRRGIFKGVSD